MTRQQIEAVLRKHGLAVEGTSYLSVADTTVCALITDLLAFAQATERRVWEKAEQIAQQEDPLNACDVAQRIIRKLHRRRATPPGGEADAHE